MCDKIFMMGPEQHADRISGHALQRVFLDGAILLFYFHRAAGAWLQMAQAGTLAVCWLLSLQKLVSSPA